MSQATQEFLSYTLTPYFIQGYGLTETTACVAISSPLHMLALIRLKEDDRLTWNAVYICPRRNSLSCILPPQIVQIGVVGVPNLCNEIQLRDFEEAGYKADGSGEHAKGRPQGEVCLRGPNVFKGYCELGADGVWLCILWREGLKLLLSRSLDKREDLTKEALTDDGWFVGLPLPKGLLTGLSTPFHVLTGWLISSPE